MTRTEVVNLAVAALLALPALDAQTQLVPLFPKSWAPYIMLASMAALWLKGHVNYGSNPDGTPAECAYRNPEGKKCQMNLP